MILSALALLIGAPLPAVACRGPFPAPISIEEAYRRADAVFLGRVTAIEEGLPRDFVPTDAKALMERRENLATQGKPSVGRTITFAYQRHWKGERRQQYVVTEFTAQNTCEWNYDVQLGDRYIIFAAANGNYLGLPAQMFDGRSLYTKLDPLSRARSGAEVLRYRDAIEKERAAYRLVLDTLNARPPAPPPTPHGPYSYAVVENSCAPTDGPAVAILLTDSPPHCEKPVESSLSFSINSDLPTGPKAYSFGLSGSVNVLRRNVPYSPVKSGTLRLTEFENGKSAAGSYEVEFRDGSVEKGSFKALWCVRRQFCG